MRALVLALAALAVHVALGLVVRGHPGPLGVDTAAFDLVEPLRGTTGVDVVAVLTDLGGYPVALAVAAAGAFLAHRAGRAGQAAGLLVGIVVLLVALNVAKELWDRPRPPARLADVRGLSYPSGHSAYATTWLAAALVTGRRGLIAASAVLLLAVMTSRLYLGVHYLSDVVGGAALGATVYAAALTRR